jgi:hypothetical protein
MKMAEKKPLYKRTWFVVVVILLVLSGVGNAIGGSEPEVTETTQQTSTPSETPAEAAAIEESPSASPEATDSPLSDPDSEESIAYFAYSSTGQFKDMDKDLDDAVKRANNDQTIRLMGNMLELTFNFGQLEALDAPTSVAKAWATGMAKLETSIDTASDIAGDFSSGQASLSEMLGSIEQVRAKVNALAKVVSNLK